jgi:BRCT domain type II-containing protein
MSVDATVDPKDPTGGTLAVPPKKLALKQISDIKKSLHRLQKIVKSIDAKPKSPKPATKAAKA